MPAAGEGAIERLGLLLAESGSLAGLKCSNRGGARQNCDMPHGQSPPETTRRILLIAGALAWLPARATDRPVDRALRDAAERNDLAVFESLIQQGADVNARDPQQDSAFLIAARSGHARLVRRALAAGADIRALNRYGSTALMGPAYRGHVETVRVLLATPIDIHHVNNLGWTALLEATVLGTDAPAHREIVRMLIERGCDVNARDRDGMSALQIAEQRGHAEVARMLLAAGARR